MFLHRTGLGGGRVPGVPGQVPVNAGAAVGVNVERPQRVSARTNDVEARKARRSLGRAGRSSRSWAEELLAVAAAEQEDEPVQVAAQFARAVGGVAGELFQGGGQGGGGRGPATG